jgi:hypothetical protein
MAAKKQNIKKGNEVNKEKQTQNNIDYCRDIN